MGVGAVVNQRWGSLDRIRGALGAKRHDSPPKWTLTVGWSKTERRHIARRHTAAYLVGNMYRSPRGKQLVVQVCQGGLPSLGLFVWFLRFQCKRH